MWLSWLKPMGLIPDTKKKKYKIFLLGLLGAPFISAASYMLCKLSTTELHCHPSTLNFDLESNIFLTVEINYIRES